MAKSITDLVLSAVRGTFGGFGALFTFRPYDELVDAGVRAHLARMRVLVTSMAALEAAVWWGSAQLAFDDPAVPSALLAVGMFLLVYILDSSLVLNDRDPGGAAPTSGRDRAFKVLAKYGFSVARLTLAVASAVVAAPLVTVQVSATRLDAEFAEDHAASVEGARQAALAPAVADLHQAAARRASAEADLRAEMDGTGGTGTIGCKAVCQAKKELLAAARQAEAERRAEVERLQNLDAEDVTSAAGLRSDSPSLTERINRVDKLIAAGDPGMIVTERAVRTAMFLLMGGILLMKMGEPKSVGNYLSVRRQEAWRRFLDGALGPAFDRRVGVEPLRRTTVPANHFCAVWEAWTAELERILDVELRRDLRAEQADAAVKRCGNAIQRVRTAQEKVTQELADLEAAERHAEDAVEDARRTSDDLGRAASVAEQRVASLESNLHAVSDEGFVPFVDRLGSMKRTLDATRNRHAEAEAVARRAERELARRRVVVRAQENRLAELRREREELEQEFRQACTNYLEVAQVPHPFVGATMPGSPALPS